MRWFLNIFILSTSICFSQSGIQQIDDLWIRGKNTNLRYHVPIQPSSFEQDTTHTCYGGVPAADIGLHADTGFTYRAAAGIALTHTGDNKFYYRVAGVFGIQRDESYYQTHSFMAHSHRTMDYFYADVRGRVSFAPNKLLRVSAGIDNQFFGEGYRSLIQGDQVAPNPFALLKVNFNRLEYGLMYQFFREDFSNRKLWKFGATHYLSYNVNRWWNIGLVESVLFHGRDSTFRRGFEVEYLNPIAFFRPQEYSLGSSDNVLLAAQTSVSLTKQTIYAQFLLDEFSLKEIRARSRWWASKFGIQLGLKGFIGEKWKYRFEGNLVRPYTYTHINETANYGNLGRPLAAAPGSNFAEILAELHYSRKAFSVKCYLDFILQGTDSDSLNWGADIYKSYLSRVREYENTIGQGNTLRTLTLGVEISYSIQTFQFFIDPNIRAYSGDSGSGIVPGVTAGLRTQILGHRRRF